MDLDSRQIRYVVQVARDLNFTRAARHLHVAQQTLSESIGQLERQLGVQLFQRSPQRVELTPAGRTFVAHAEALLREVETTITATLAAAREAQSTVRIGTPDWPSGIELFRTGVDEHRRRHPGLTVVLDPTPWVRHIDAVVQRRIDVGVTLVGGPRDLPDGIATAALVPDTTGYVFVSDEHPLADAGVVTDADLARFPILFISRADHPALHDRLADHLRSRRIGTAADTAAAGSFATAVAHAMVADALVWVSSFMAAAPPTGLRALEAPMLELPLTLVAFCRADDERSRAMLDTLAAVASGAPPT